MKTIKILGAGVSGLTAAINLAKEGYKVKVYERLSDVGRNHKLNFEGLENFTTNILKLLKDINIKLNFRRKGLKRVKWYSPKFKSAIIEDKTPLFYLVERGGNNSLEYSLKEQALQYSVEFEFNSATKKADIIGILSDHIAPKGYFYILVWNNRACAVTLGYKPKRF